MTLVMIALFFAQAAVVQLQIASFRNDHRNTEHRVEGVEEEKGKAIAVEHNEALRKIKELEGEVQKGKAIAIEHDEALRKVEEIEDRIDSIDAVKEQETVVNLAKFVPAHMATKHELEMDPQMRKSLNEIRSDVTKLYKDVSAAYAKADAGLAKANAGLRACGHGSSM